VHEPGSSFGELALFDGNEIASRDELPDATTSVRGESVVALTFCELYKLDKVRASV